MCPSQTNTLLVCPGLGLNWVSLGNVPCLQLTGTLSPRKVSPASSLPLTSTISPQLSPSAFDPRPLHWRPTPSADDLPAPLLPSLLQLSLCLHDEFFRGGSLLLSSPMQREDYFGEQKMQQGQTDR